MRLFFDLRLGYLVEAPGQSTPASGYIGKAGDGQPVELQFGRSADPLGSSILFEAPTWTSTGLPGGTVIQLAIKASGEFSDGPVLASTSTFSYDAGTKTYSGALNLNTEQINTDLERGNDDDEDDIASVLCGLEVTYQSGGSGAWSSSVLPVPYQINHDLIYGDEASPVNAESPDEYLLKASGYEWLPTITSKIGGTASDLDGIPTVARPVGGVVAFKDTDASLNQVRLYRLETSTEAEASPDYIRPDDFNASTNAKVWVFLRQVSDAIIDPTTATGDIIYRNSGGDLVALAIGTTGKVLKVAAGLPSWGDDLAGMTNPMTTAGDIIIGGTSGSPSRLGIGSTGKVLTVTGGVPAWETASGGAGAGPQGYSTKDTTGDLLLTDANKMVSNDGANSITLTILQQSSVSWPNGTVIWYHRPSSNTLTIAAGSGVTIIGGPLEVAQGETVAVWRQSENFWRILYRSDVLV
jgi:hypothetical protein